MSKFNPFKSTIFNKVIMASTGGILVLFIIGHMAGNLLLLFGRDVFNSYAYFLHSTGELLWIVRAVLLITLLLHIFTAIKLKRLNKAAKPENYRIKKYVASTIFSRSMAYTGLMIFFLVAYHLLHYTIYVVEPEFGDYREPYGPKLQTEAVVETNDGELMTVNAGDGIFERHDAFKMVIVGFSNPLVSLVYLLFVFFVCMHLNHGIQSMFQSLGIHGPKLSPFLRKMGYVVSWGIFAGFSLIPISVTIFGYGKGVIGL